MGLFAKMLRNGRLRTSLFRRPIAKDILMLEECRQRHLDRAITYFLWYGNNFWYKVLWVSLGTSYLSKVRFWYDRMF